MWISFPFIFSSLVIGTLQLCCAALPLCLLNATKPACFRTPLELLSLKALWLKIIVLLLLCSATSLVFMSYLLLLTSALRGVFEFDCFPSQCLSVLLCCFCCLSCWSGAGWHCSVSQGTEKNFFFDVRKIFCPMHLTGITGHIADRCWCCSCLDSCIFSIWKQIWFCLDEVAEIFSTIFQNPPETSQQV